MNKIDNRMIAGIILILFALIALVMILIFMQQNSASTVSTPQTDSVAQPVVDEVDTGQNSSLSESTTSSQPSSQDQAVVPTDWVSAVNAIRSSAGVPEIIEDSALTNGSNLHAMYVVANDDFSHRENPSLPKYTADGDAAAQNGLIFATSQTSFGYQEAIAFWASGPFHLVPLLNPRLDKMGYSTFVDAGDPGVKMSGIMNLGPRASHGADEDVYPAMYPGNGRTTSVLSQTLPEWPDAMGHCGWSRPVGAPIVLMIGPGNETPNIGNYAVTQNGSPIEVCMLSETNFSHPDGSQQSTGRNILNSLDAVVLIPRSPLQAGSSFNVDLEVNGVAHNWTFNTR